MNLRQLFENLDADARNVLHTTAETAARDGRASISVEFFLLSLLRDRRVGPDLMKTLQDAELDAPAIETVLASQVAKEPRGSSGVLPSFDESLAKLMREAWSLVFDEYGESKVTPVRFFETVARRGEYWPRLAMSLPGFNSQTVGKLSAAGSKGARNVSTGDDTGIGAGGAPDAQFPELSRYGYDMIRQARETPMDPVVGFSTEMQALAAILLRRRQNSAIIVGEAGVGKTACGLGFIDALAKGAAPVPQSLHDTPVWFLDVSALRAGASVRGALEERFQAIAREVNDAGMLLFMDDIHLLFGDQGQGADVLRSVLSSGSIRIMGTCGWKEWRRYIEPDPGLARRLASVRVQEPDHESALKIVEGISPKLADHHDVQFGEDVLESSVVLARRYIVGRQLPDKAIVVLDSACARARMNSNVDGNGNGSDTVKAENDVEAAEEVAQEDAGQPQADVQPVTVKEEDVATVVSDLTGVPIGGMLSDVSKTAITLEDTLRKRVVGQDEALERCASQARSYLAGLSDRRRPVGALIFCGPSGVGKTETAHALADVLFGGRILTINMSEYQEAHTVSGLKGAPAGYVGYGEGGVLTEGIRRTPYCVVLLDEIEKAHGDVIEMLYQVLDKGWMEDAEGIEADFSNSLIILTTNAGDTVIERAAAAESPPDKEQFHQVLTKDLAKVFPAAFIGRLQLVPYWPLGEETLAMIAGMRLDRLVSAYAGSHRAELSFDQSLHDWLAARVKSTPQGARFLDGIIAGSIRPVVAEYVINKLGKGEPPGNATVSRDGDSCIVVPT